jgi:YegS/Rv2252/BmrU family lipid kinase
MREEIGRASSEGFHSILLMGGDGTVHEALPAIKEAGLPFGLLPCGRGNDYARNIGLSLDLKSNCFFPYEPVLEELDMPLINDIPFGSIACLGFDAEVNKFARGKKGFFGGTLGYIVCVIRALKAFEPFVIDIKIDDFHWSGKIMMVAISNGPYYGGGMKIAPEACMDNGLFDVCIVKEISKWELMKEFPKIFQGTHLSHPSVILKSGRTVEVLSEENREIFADGEYVGRIPCKSTVGSLRIQVMKPQKYTGHA